MRLFRASERKSFSPPNSKAAVSILAGAGPQYGRLEKHTVAIVTLPPGAELEEHFHTEREESYLVVSGSGEAIVNSERVPLTPGDLLTVWPGEHHLLRAAANQSLEYVVVTAPAWTPEDVHPCC